LDFDRRASIPVDRRCLFSPLLSFHRCETLSLSLSLRLFRDIHEREQNTPVSRTHCVLCLGSSDEATSCGDTANAAAPEVGRCIEELAPPPAPFIVMASAAEGGKASAGPAHPGPSASACERGLAYMFFLKEEKKKRK